MVVILSNTRCVLGQENKFELEVCEHHTPDDPKRARGLPRGIAKCFLAESSEATTSGEPLSDDGLRGVTERFLDKFVNEHARTINPHGCPQVTIKKFLFKSFFPNYVYLEGSYTTD